MWHSDKIAYTCTHFVYYAPCTVHTLHSKCFDMIQLILELKRVYVTLIVCSSHHHHHPLDFIKSIQSLLLQTFGLAICECGTIEWLRNNFMKNGIHFDANCIFITGISSMMMFGDGGWCAWWISYGSVCDYFFSNVHLHFYYYDYNYHGAVACELLLAIYFQI